MSRLRPDESGWNTRKRLIDPKLRTAGWLAVKYGPTQPIGKGGALAIEEFPTDNGAADYALIVDEQVLGVVEARNWGSCVRRNLVPTCNPEPRIWSTGAQRRTVAQRNLPRQSARPRIRRK